MSIFNRFLHPQTSKVFKNEHQRYTFFGSLFGLTFPIVGSIFEIFWEGLSLSPANFIRIQTERPLLWIVDTAPFVLGTFAAVIGRRQDDLIQTNKELNAREKELEDIKLNLEIRIKEHTHDLIVAREQAEKRATRLQITAEISQTITLSHNTSDLLQIITHVISEKFNFYHTGIFLLDETKEYAILQAANSEGGKRMLAKGHRLKVGGIGIVGYAAQSGRSRIALNTGEDAVYFNNPELRETHSEAALPLKTGTTVIGVLDVQSKDTDAFSDEDVDTLNTLANQVAVMIQNARLYEQSRAALASFTKLGFGNWREFVEGNAAGYSFLPDGKVIPAMAETVKEIDRFIASNRTEQPDSASEDAAALAVPVKLREEVIGVIHIKRRDAQHTFTEDEIAVVQSISERAALALENARLFEETSRKAEQERLISQVTSRISESNNFDHILWTTIHELGRALGTTRAFIQLEAPTSQDSSELQSSAS